MSPEPNPEALLRRAAGMSESISLPLGYALQLRQVQRVQQPELIMMAFKIR
jgi:hypothetical protein